MREGWGDDPFLCLFVGHEALRAKLHYDPGTLHWTTQYLLLQEFHFTFFSLMKHRVVGTCCQNLTQIRQLYCCCNSRGKEGSLKDGFYPKLSGSWGHCFHHHLLNSQHQKFLSGGFFQKFLGWSPGVPRLPIIHLSALLLSSFAYPPNTTLFTMWCNMFYSCATYVQTIWSY